MFQPRFPLLCCSGDQAIIVFRPYRTFLRIPRHPLETEQAIRLIRAVMHLPKETPLVNSTLSAKLAGKQRETLPTLSEAIVRTLVSVAENPDDSLQAVCVETLAELGEC